MTHNTGHEPAPLDFLLGLGWETEHHPVVSIAEPPIQIQLSSRVGGVEIETPNPVIRTRGPSPPGGIPAVSGPEARRTALPASGRGQCRPNGHSTRRCRSRTSSWVRRRPQPAQHTPPARDLSSRNSSEGVLKWILSGRMQQCLLGRARPLNAEGSPGSRGARCRSSSRWGTSGRITMCCPRPRSQCPVAP